MNKKRVVILISLIVLLFIFIDLFVRMPWKKEQVSLNGERTEIINNDGLNSEEEDISVVENDIYEQKIDDNETILEYNDDNFKDSVFDDLDNEPSVSDMIKNYDTDNNSLKYQTMIKTLKHLYFSSVEINEQLDIDISDNSKKMSQEEINKLIEHLNKVWLVGAGLNEKESLVGIVDDVSLNIESQRNFDIFLETINRLSEYAIKTYVPISENSYSVDIILTNQVGDLKPGADYSYEQKTMSLIYNTEHSLLSFRDVFKRHKSNIEFEDNRFRIEVVFIEADLNDTNLYMTFSHKYDFDVNIKEIPDIVADITIRDEREMKSLLLIDYMEDSDLTVKPGERIIFKGMISPSMVTLNSIAINNQ